MSTTPPDRFGEHKLRERFSTKRLTSFYSLRAMTSTHMQGYAAGIGILCGAAFIIGPWLWEEMGEMRDRKFVPVSATQMPRTSPVWWENEWRRMNPVWRRGESSSDFYKKPFAFVQSQTGRDLTSAESFLATHPHAWDKKKNHDHSSQRSHLLWRLWTSQTSSPEAPSSPKALVPLCGDSPIIAQLARGGYDVDAVDCAGTAIQAAIERTELLLQPEDYKRVHLHWSDIFSPELWQNQLQNKKFDVIYERQGITSLNREDRDDYAHLLRRSLKDDGIMYVEGIFRTGRVRGNKVRGPPYSLSRKEMERLFPKSEGYHVRCEERSDEMSMLSRENRILQRVPRELYVTPFSCVVFKSPAVNLDSRDAYNNSNSSSDGHSRANHVETERALT